MQIFAELLLLLVAARACGAAAVRLGQPAAVGELIAGIALAGAAAAAGPAVPLLGALGDSRALAFAADFGVFFLVLLAGIEMAPRELAGAPRTSLAVAAGGAALPLAGGFALAWLFLPEGPARGPLALLTGIAISISAIPATVKVLRELGLLHRRVGRVIVAAALFDDVIGLVLLAVLSALVQTGAVPPAAEFAVLLAKVAAFFALAGALGVHVYPRISRRLRKTQAAAIEFSALAGVGMAYGLLADALGMHWVLGPFMAGLFFERHRVGDAAYQDLRLTVGAITDGFLGPLFFAYIGMRVDPGAVAAAPGFLALLVGVALAGKLLGCGIPALAAGLPPREAAAIGVGMSARGAVELVILSVAWQAGLFAAAGADPVSANLYSALVLTAVLTTLAAPLALRRVLPPTSAAARS